MHTLKLISINDANNKHNSHISWNLFSLWLREKFGSHLWLKLLFWKISSEFFLKLLSDSSQPGRYIVPPMEFMCVRQSDVFIVFNWTELNWTESHQFYTWHSYIPESLCCGYFIWSIQSSECGWWMARKRWSDVYVYRPTVSKWISRCRTHDTCSNDWNGRKK